MYEQLFGSKTRVKLLKLFFSNPSRSFYVREITRKIREQINSVRRELANLMTVGLVKSREQDNRLYYFLNENFKHYGEFKAVFSGTETEEEEADETASEDAMVKAIKQLGTVQYAQLSGYFVGDDSCPVDVFVVGDINRSRFHQFVEHLQEENKRELNFSVLTPEEFQYRRMLYDKFVTEILNSRKIILVDELEEVPA